MLAEVPLNSGLFWPMSFFNAAGATLRFLLVLRFIARLMLFLLLLASHYYSYYDCCYCYYVTVTVTALLLSTIMSS